MQAALAEIDVLRFGRMKLDHAVLRIPKQVLHFAHQIPSRRTLVSDERNAHMLPSSAIRRDALHAIFEHPKPEKPVESPRCVRVWIAKQAAPMFVEEIPVTHIFGRTFATVESFDVLVSPATLSIAGWLGSL